MEPFRPIDYLVDWIKIPLTTLGLKLQEAEEDAPALMRAALHDHEELAARLSELLSAIRKELRAEEEGGTDCSPILELCGHIRQPQYPGRDPPERFAGPGQENGNQRGRPTPPTVIEGGK